MKLICILYNPSIDKEQKKLANTLSSVLKQNNYNTKLVSIRTEQDTYHFIQDHSPETCQLVVSINMAGYNLLSTDSSPSLNRLMMNIVNYIDFPPEIFDPILSMRMNFTMSFLFSSQKNANYVKKTHPLLRNIFGAPCIKDFLPAYLKDLDWRY